MQTVREVMTTDLKKVDADTSCYEVARIMRDAGVGDVIVEDNGILTDRDIVVRAIATGEDLGQCTAGAIASRDLRTVTPDTPTEEAVDMMRSNAVRRLPVMEGGRIIGVISIGDLALARQERSALAGISGAALQHINCVCTPSW